MKTTKKNNKNNHLVQQSNALIETSQKMTLIERRLIYHVLSRINPQKPQQEYVLKVSDFAQDFPQMDSAHVYGQLKNAVNALYKRDVQLITDRGSTKIFHLIQEQEYKDNEGYLRMKFSDSTMPLIFELKEKYTTMILENFKTLDSAHSLKLYELFCQYRNVGEREIKIEDLRFFLGCEETYPDFKIFNQMLLKPAIKEICEKTDLIVNFEILRTSRSVSSIKFRFTEKISDDIIDSDFKVKPLKAPKIPAIKRHPNPKNEKYLENGKILYEKFYRDSFEWAVENYKRIFNYDIKLKEVGLELSDKEKDRKTQYLNKMAEVYTKFKQNGWNTDVLDNLKNDIKQ